MTYEKALISQAELRIVRGSTNERKQMSTKTLRKRIALVAVSALGFGLVSTVPATAAITGGAVFTASTAAATVGKPVTISVTLSGATVDDTETNELTLTVPSKPSSSAVTVGSALAYAADALPNQPVIGAGAAFLRGGKAILGSSSATSVSSGDTLTMTVTNTSRITATATDGSDAGTVTTATKASVATIVFTPDVAGTYTLTVTPGTGTASSTVVTATVASAPAVIVAAAARGDRAGDNSVLQSIAPAGLGSAKLQLVTSPDTQTALTTGAVYTSASTGIIAGAAVSGGAVNFTFDTDGTGVTNGTYTFRAWEDILNAGVVDATETATTLTVTVASDAKKASLTLGATSVAVDGTNAVTIAASVAAKDVDGVTSYRISTETVSDANQATNGFTLSAVGGTLTIPGNTAAGVYTVKALVSTDTGAAYTSSKTITVISTGGTASTLSIAAGTGLVFDTTYAGTAKSNEALGTAAATVTADTTVTSLSFKFTGGNYAAGSARNVPVTVALAAGTPFTAVTAPSFALIAPDGTGTVTITTTTPEDGYSFKVQIPDGINGAGKYLGFTVTYTAAAPQFQAVNQSPAAAFTAKTLTANTVSAILDNGYGVVMATKPVSISVSGRNPITTSATTDAAGKVSYTWTDAAAVATATTDTVVFSYAYIDADGLAAAAQATFTVTYTATGIVIGAVKVTYPATIGGVAIAPRIDTVNLLGTPADTADNLSPVVTYSASVSDSNGLPLKSVVVMWTADANTKLSAAASVTDATGVATIKASRNLIGYGSVTGTVMGTANTNATLKWVTRDYNAAGATASNVYRNLTLTTDTPSVVAGGAIRYTAKVTDRWGNPVASVPLSLRLTGAGRLMTGEALSGAAVVTALDGTFQWNVSSLTSEVGDSSATVTVAGGQTADIAGYVTTGAAYPVTGVTAGNVTATATSKFTKDTSTSTADALLALATALGTRDQASAAVDAAAEATDAANAATDAANAAAEAADAATAAAQDASDAVAALSAQVSEAIAGLKKQLVSLTNLVIKIQKKVKA